MPLRRAHQEVKSQNGLGLGSCPMAFSQLDELLKVMDGGLPTQESDDFNRCSVNETIHEMLAGEDREETWGRVGSDRESRSARLILEQ